MLIYAFCFTYQEHRKALKSGGHRGLIELICMAKINSYGKVIHKAIIYPFQNRISLTFTHQLATVNDKPAQDKSSTDFQQTARVFPTNCDWASEMDQVGT